jgi:hypothetical protein
MPWVEPILNDVGLVTFVKCWVHTKFERKEKVLMAK